jgi:hypothetical protein
LIILALSLVSGARGGDQFETDTNRFGKDIRDFDLEEESPRLCYDACVADKHCHSFTYLRPHGWPGAGDKAHCWLKWGVPAPRHELCCVSGIVRPGEDPPPPKPLPPMLPPPKPEPPAVGVSEVKLEAIPAAYQGACPIRIEYRGVIVAKGRGTVTYLFTHGDQAGDQQKIRFNASGPKEVRFTRMAGTPGKQEDFRETLRIIDPVYCVRAPCPGWVTESSAEAVTALNCSDNPKGAESPKTADRP